LTKEWAYMTSKQLEKSLSSVHRALFDTLILHKECVKSSEKQYLPELKQSIYKYQKLIQEYEAGIITLKDREVFHVE